MVVLDNLGAHKAPAARAALAGTGMLLLPRYSPKHNPVELLRDQVKRVLRGVTAWTAAALDEAITRALLGVGDVREWFRHCGYCTERP